MTLEEQILDILEEQTLDILVKHKRRELFNDSDFVVPELLALIETEKVKAIKKILKAVRLSKQSTCGCGDAFGYHSKECNLLPYGYNQAVDDLNTKIDKLLE